MLGKYILRGYLPAIMATATSAMLSFVLPPLAYMINGTVVGLIALRKGAVFGLQAMAGSLLTLLFLSRLADLPYQLGIGYALGIWLPVCTVALVLRYTESQGLALLTAGSMAVVFIVGIYILVEDVPAWWHSWFTGMLEKTVPKQEMPDYLDVLETTPISLNSLISAGMMLNIMMSLLLARWWQAKLFNKGAFLKEFCTLRLPPIVLPVSGILVMLALAASGMLQDISRDILLVMLFMYLIQGISAMHRAFERFKLSATWLVVMYVVLILQPLIGMFIACFGIADVYSNWRQKQM